MPHGFAERFAEVSLNDFKHEGTFAITVPSEDFDATAQAFERRGCDVERDAHTFTLVVTCPEELNQPTAK